MQGQKPVKLYFFVTFLLILAILLIGLKIKEYISQKYPEHQEEKNETVAKKRTDDLSQTFALVDLTLGISLVLVLIFVIVKIIMSKLKKY